MKSVHLLEHKNDKTLQLKDFIYELNKKQIHTTSFSYCHDELDLIPSLNLKENLTLNQSPFKQNSIQAPTYFSLQGRESFKNFSKYIYDYSLLPEQADNQSQKVVTLLRCITSAKKYLFFNSPEKNLSHLSLIALKKLMFEVKNHHEIFIASNEVNFWSDLLPEHSRNSFSDYHQAS